VEYSDQSYVLHVTQIMEMYHFSN